MWQPCRQSKAGKQKPDNSIFPGQKIYNFMIKKARSDKQPVQSKDNSSTTSKGPASCLS